MASFEKFAKNIGKGDIVSAYTNVLNDVNYCINLFEELEIGRTQTEERFDSIAGEREQINLQDLPKNLDNLKTEIEVGLRLYMRLSCKRDILNSNQSSQDSKLRSIMYSDKTTPRWGIEQELRSQFEELLSAVASIKRPEKVQWNYGIFEYIPGVVSYRDRKLLYNDARILYQTLKQDEILRVLKENHASIRELIGGVDDAIRDVNTPQRYTRTDTFAEDNVTSQQRNSTENTEQISSKSDSILNPEQSNLVANTEPHLDSDSSSSPNRTKLKVEQLGVTDPVDCPQNTSYLIDDIDLARAKDNYNTTFVAELEELDSTEKSISKETRNGMAKRAAVRSCKRFLKEELNFSNSKAALCIRILQEASKIQ